MGNYNRDNNRSSRGGYSGGGRDRDRSRGPREMFDAVCDECGRDCQIPFRPTNGRPVYCNNCFGGKDNSSSAPRHSHDRDRGSSRPSFPRRTESRPQESAQLTAVLSKLDKILEALVALQTPKPSARELIEVAVEKEQKEKAPAKKKKPATKAKKTTKTKTDK